MLLFSVILQNWHITIDKYHVNKKYVSDALKTKHDNYKDIMQCILNIDNMVNYAIILIILIFFCISTTLIYIN